MFLQSFLKSQKAPSVKLQRFPIAIPACSDSRHWKQLQWVHYLPRRRSPGPSPCQTWQLERKDSGGLQWMLCKLFSGGQSELQFGAVCRATASPCCSARASIDSEIFSVALLQRRVNNHRSSLLLGHKGSTLQYKAFC